MLPGSRNHHAANYFLAMALVFSRDYEDDYFGTLIKESKLSLYHIALKSTPFFLMIPIMAIVSYLFLTFKLKPMSLTFPMLILVTL
jgi:ABC-2 type transport system permease protein